MIIYDRVTHMAIGLYKDALSTFSSLSLPCYLFVEGNSRIYIAYCSRGCEIPVSLGIAMTFLPHK